MEFLTIFLSSLMVIIAPAGGIIEHVAEQELRQQFVATEQLQVRIDNTPSYQVLQGKADRIRIAGRGLFPLKDIRIAVLELETDAVALNPQRARRGKVQLDAPLRFGVRLTLNEADLNRALQSPIALDWLRSLGTGVVEDQDTRRRIQRYEFRNPRITFLDQQRLRFQVALREPGDLAQLDIVVESGVAIVQGRQVQLVQPKVTLNGEAVPEELLRGMVEGILERSDLRQLEADGMTARVLHCHMDNHHLSLAAFVQVLPAALQKRP
jgi:hypothetical protein